MSNFINDLGWTLIHFLWQGILIAVALRLFLSCVPRENSSLRYLVASSSLRLCLLTCAGTFCYLESGPVSPEPGASPGPVTVLASLPLGASPIHKVEMHLQSQVNHWIWYVVFVWMLGVFISTVRLSWALFSVQALLAKAVPFTEPVWNGRIARISAKLGIQHRVRILCSNIDPVPIVVGFFRPTILLPLSLLTLLSPEELELILAHELAHIRRNDYLANLVQIIIESILFYHPLVWWISSEVRKEREYCCDDMAVGINRLGNDRLLYAKALTQLEAWRDSNDTMGLALGAADKPLLQRIKRILGVWRSEPVYFQIDRSLAALILGGALFLALSRLLAESTPVSPYAWKTNIVTSDFWFGRTPPPDLDDGQNPFNVSLPFSDLEFPDKAKKWLPADWAQPASPVPFTVSACEGHWVEIKTSDGRICYAQWNGFMGPPQRPDDAEYVFGNEKPAGSGAALVVSPAVAAYLRINGKNDHVTSWRFVKPEDVPGGDWLKYEEGPKLVAQSVAQNYFRKSLDIETLTAEARQLFNDKQYNEAAERYQKIIMDRPDNFFAWSSLGVVRFQQQEYVKAEKAFQQALKISPNDDLIKRDLKGTELMLQSGPQADLTAVTKEFASLMGGQDEPDQSSGMIWIPNLNSRLTPSVTLTGIGYTRASYDTDGGLAGLTWVNVPVNPPTPAKTDSAAAQHEFAMIVEEIQDASEMKKLNPAVAKPYFQESLIRLLKLRSSWPNWQAELVSARIKDCSGELGNSGEASTTAAPSAAAPTPTPMPTPDPLAGIDSRDVQSQYVTVWLELEKGYNLIDEKKPAQAKQTFQEALIRLLHIRRRDPDWEPQLVASRIRDCEVEIKKLQ